MGSGFEPVGPSQILDAQTHRACGVLAHKIHGSENPAFGRYQFTMGVLSGENFSPFQRHIKIVNVEMDGAAICRIERQMSDSCHCKMGLAVTPLP